ncbi:MAG: helix-turn-helix domain-containing protein [Gammaproteobacteria bacterium]
MPCGHLGIRHPQGGLDGRNGDSGHPAGSLRLRFSRHSNSNTSRHARHPSNPPRPYTNLTRKVVSPIIGTGGLTVGELAAKADVSVPTVYNIIAGRAQNPHPRTIASLEQALGDTCESKEEAREASEIAGIGQLIDFNPYDPKEISAKAGVYVLYDISQRPIYVGKASKISGRLNDHSTTAHNFGTSAR